MSRVTCDRVPGPLKTQKKRAWGDEARVGGGGGGGGGGWRGGGGKGMVENACLEGLIPSVSNPIHYTYSI